MWPDACPAHTRNMQELECVVSVRSLHVANDAPNIVSNPPRIEDNLVTSTVSPYRNWRSFLAQLATKMRRDCRKEQTAHKPNAFGRESFVHFPTIAAAIQYYGPLSHLNDTTSPRAREIPAHQVSILQQHGVDQPYPQVSVRRSTLLPQAVHHPPRQR